jgi:hypothetical protein
VLLLAFSQQLKSWEEGELLLGHPILLDLIERLNFSFHKGWEKRRPFSEVMWGSS